MHPQTEERKNIFLTLLPSAASLLYACARYDANERRKRRVKTLESQKSHTLTRWMRTRVRAAAEKGVARKRKTRWPWTLRRCCSPAATKPHIHGRTSHPTQPNPVGRRAIAKHSQKHSLATLSHRPQQAVCCVYMYLLLMYKPNQSKLGLHWHIYHSVLLRTYFHNNRCSHTLRIPSPIPVSCLPVDCPCYVLMPKFKVLRPIYSNGSFFFFCTLAMSRTH